MWLWGIFEIRINVVGVSHIPPFWCTWRLCLSAMIILKAEDEYHFSCRAITNYEGSLFWTTWVSELEKSSESSSRLRFRGVWAQHPNPPSPRSNFSHPNFLKLYYTYWSTVLFILLILKIFIWLRSLSAKRPKCKTMIFKLGVESCCGR